MKEFEWDGRNVWVASSEGKVVLGVFLPFGNGESQELSREEALSTITALTQAVAHVDAGREEREAEKQNDLATTLRELFEKYPGQPEQYYIMREFNLSMHRIFLGEAKS